MNGYELCAVLALLGLAFVGLVTLVAHLLRAFSLLLVDARRRNSHFVSVGRWRA